MRRRVGIALDRPDGVERAGRQIDVDQDERRRRARDLPSSAPRYCSSSTWSRWDGAQIARPGALQQGVAEHVARVRIGGREQQRRHQGCADPCRSRRSGDRPWPPRHLPVLAPECLWAASVLPLHRASLRWAGRRGEWRIGGCTTELDGRPGPPEEPDDDRSVARSGATLAGAPRQRSSAGRALHS